VSSKTRFATWHFLLISHPVGIASGPVQAEHREPKGSLDGWRDARSFMEGGNGRLLASSLYTASANRRCSPLSPCFHPHSS
jgi:hypothetical protein